MNKEIQAVEEMEIKEDENTLENLTSSVIFNKPYKFEGKEYTYIDLSGLEDLSGRDITEVEQKYNKLGYFSVNQEMSMPYVLMMAAKVTEKPVEFFDTLPAKECIKIKNTVMGFLYSKD